jgi:hypothetical protein
MSSNNWPQNMPPNTIVMGTELLCFGGTVHYCFEDSASAVATVTSCCYLKVLHHHEIDPRAILWWLCLLYMGFKLTRFTCIYTTLTSFDTYTDSQFLQVRMPLYSSSLFAQQVCSLTLLSHAITVWFRQGGAAAHMVRASLKVVWEVFPQHVTIQKCID